MILIAKSAAGVKFAIPTSSVQAILKQDKYAELVSDSGTSYLMEVPFDVLARECKEMVAFDDILLITPSKVEAIHSIQEVVTEICMLTKRFLVKRTLADTVAALWPSKKDKVVDVVDSPKEEKTAPVESEADVKITPHKKVEVGRRDISKAPESEKPVVEEPIEEPKIISSGKERDVGSGVGVTF